MKLYKIKNDYTKSVIQAHAWRKFLEVKARQRQVHRGGYGRPPKITPKIKIGTMDLPAWFDFE